MRNVNFSTSQQEVRDLILDLNRGTYTLSDDLTKYDLEQHLRGLINKDLLKGRNMYQALRRNAIDLYEVIEEVVDTTIGEDVLDSPFVREFVEVKNRKLGDDTAWYSEGGLLSVASFAGNHWDTNRQALDLGEEFTLPKEWVFIHVYAELERFLLGYDSLEKMMDKIYKSTNKYFQDRIFAQFQNVANSVPADLVATGNDEVAVGNLCDIVQAAGGYNELTIAGTKGALRKLAGVVPDKMFANSQREAKALTGSIGEWEGNKLMVIPQTLKPGTFEKALSDNTLFIMGGGAKPIKFEILDDTRSDMDTTGKKYNDMTIDVQVQTHFGIGLSLPEYFGVFNFPTA